MHIWSKLKNKCKSKIYVVFGNEGSHCSLINPGAKDDLIIRFISKMFSLLEANTLFLLVSFSVFEMVIFPAFSFDLVPNIKHWKNVQSGRQKSPSCSKAFEINHGKQHSSLGCQQELMWGRMKAGGWSAPPIHPQRTGTHSSDYLLGLHPLSKRPCRWRHSWAQTGRWWGRCYKWPTRLSSPSVRIGSTGPFSSEILFFLNTFRHSKVLEGGSF